MTKPDDPLTPNEAFAQAWAIYRSARRNRRKARERLIETYELMGEPVPEEIAFKRSRSEGTTATGVTHE